MRKIVLYTRRECHLCDEAKAAMMRHFPDLAIEEIDVDTDPELIRLYGEEVRRRLSGGNEGVQISPGRQTIAPPAR